MILEDYWNHSKSPKDYNYITVDGFGRIEIHCEEPALIGPVWIADNSITLEKPSSKYNIYSATLIKRI